jgi:hypothetical protein
MAQAGLGSIHTIPYEFVVDKLAVGHALFWVLQFYCESIIPPVPVLICLYVTDTI